jgi:hypothetical protein
MNVKIQGFIILFLLTVSCNTLKKDFSTMKSIDLFKICITGDFNNRRQIDEQLKSGKQIHPLAIHVNRVADHKIINGPNINGFWILEESYYTKPGSDSIETKPYLFLFEKAEDNKVKLTPYTLPPQIDLKSVRNDNDNLRFDFNGIRPSPSFKPAFYIREGNSFKLNAPNELPNGMKFTLTETITTDQLIVMELLEKDGKRLTPFNTPIVYDRIR